MSDKKKQAAASPTLVYQADSVHSATVNDIRDKVMRLCGNHMNKYVCVKMSDGRCYEGVIMHVDRSFVYLQCTMRDPRLFNNPYNAVLPLMLFDLLVIAPR
ncbi:hypothetical protein [Paenibacillus harenae]|uniref:hypothetical protein n=1 Tax=Paenibacillus harenae TaxID=306543 RepID=UPI00278F4623|nr:hypothetical protein [Paenibacillus harenae]MDQ0062322.1 hypothetical protein [Paenibacillus harenae]